MQQFSLEKWLQDKSRKVVTRTGEPVEIVLTDWGDPFTILGRIGNSGDPIIWLSDGRSDMDAKLHDNDLFFADEEEDEFETTMISFSHAMFDHLLESTNVKVDVKAWKNKLLDLARKEIEKEDWRTPLRAYKNGYEQGKQDALKDLPKWKKVDSNPAKFQYNLQGKRLYKDGEYYIELSDLETLPKEE